jgi:hypothetical protein
MQAATCSPPCMAFSATPGNPVEAGEVADDERLGMGGYRQVGVDGDASRSVGLGGEQCGGVAGEGHGLDTDRPQDRAGGVVLAGAALGTHEVQFHAQLLQGA